jgi:hypothetical protein
MMRVHLAPTSVEVVDIRWANNFHPATLACVLAVSMSYRPELPGLGFVEAVSTSLEWALRWTTGPPIGNLAESESCVCITTIRSYPDADVLGRFTPELPRLREKLRRVLPHRITGSVPDKTLPDPSPPEQSPQEYAEAPRGVAASRECSFCGSKDYAALIVTGESSICDSCVELAQEILDEKGMGDIPPRTGQPAQFQPEDWYEFYERHLGGGVRSRDDDIWLFTATSIDTARESLRATGWSFFVSKIVDIQHWRGFEFSDRVGNRAVVIESAVSES